MTSRDTVRCCITLLTSTIGEPPTTVIVSSTPPTRMSAFTRGDERRRQRDAFANHRLNPGSSNVTV